MNAIYFTTSVLDRTITSLHAHTYDDHDFTDEADCRLVIIRRCGVISSVRSTVAEARALAELLGLTELERITA